MVLQIWELGYSVLGLTPQTLPLSDPWHYGRARPPSYRAFGRYRFARTLWLAERLRPQRVLEVGAGDGFLGACLATAGREVSLNDLRYPQVGQPHWSTQGNLQWSPGNFFDLRSEDFEPFDLVVAAEVIEHVAHGGSMVAHLTSFLRPGGTLMLTTPSGEYFRSQLPTYSQVADFSAFEIRQFQPDADGHLYLYTEDELRTVMRADRLEGVEVDSSATPWIAGGIGLRHAAGVLSSRACLGLDKVIGRTRIGRRLFTQLIATSRRAR